MPRISRATSRVGLGAEQRLEHLRGRALGGRDVVERVVEGLRRASGPRDQRQLASCAGVGLEFSDVSRPSSSALRSSRESLCSEVSTWSSCTGVAVWVILIVSPESSSGASGVPGLRSTKKLPSRKMRGRIFAVASSCSGSAESLSSMHQQRGVGALDAARPT